MPLLISVGVLLETPRSVRKFANEVVGPKVREMDENEMMDPAVIQGLFDQGVGCIHHVFDVVLLINA